MEFGRILRARRVALTSTVLLAALGALASGSAGAGSSPRPQALAPAVPGELIVRFKAGVSEGSRSLALQRVGAKERRRFARLNAKLVSVAPNALKAAERRLEADPRVQYAEPNYVVSVDAAPNDPSYSSLWGLHNTGQNVNGVTGTADADIDAQEAWDVTTGSSNVVVAVIDTGVDFSHADLGGSAQTSPLMWTNPGESCTGCRTDGLDNDGNGYVDDWRGWDFVGADGDPTDDHSHGTHVTGTIGATGDNGIGVAGVSRGGVKIMALKFLDADGYGTTADAVNAILYAAGKGAHVMNNSWGGGEFSQALLDAIREADTRGSLFVAAAGNDTVDNDVTPHYPSSYDVPNVVSVASTTATDGLSWFSNWGSKSVDLGAPGSNIYSTVPGNGYQYFQGTSMATPHVAGAAALAKAAFPGASHLGLKALLLRTVDAKSALAQTATGGRLNANAAVRCGNAPKVWLQAPDAAFRVNLNEPLTLTVLGANCAEPGGVTVAATANGEPVVLTARGDGLYTGIYTPTTAGAVTITASATVGTVTDSRSVTGAAEDNYRHEDAPFAWIDATASGTNTGLTVDDGSVTLPLPFAFTFYRSSFSSVKVSTNGYLVFGSGDATAFSNRDIPDSTAPNGYAAPYWDDLNPAAGGSIWYRTFGSAPNRKFVVAWIDVPQWSSPSGVTFEAVLEEGTNDVVYQYRDLNHAEPAHDYGASATVGVENLDGSVGKKFSYMQPLLQPYENARSLRFSQGAPPPPDAVAPAAPTALTASAGDARVTLDWADNGEADLAGYRVYRQNADSTWSAIATPGASTYTDTGLANGTQYTYRVTAFDHSQNESAASNEASATPVRAPIVKTYRPTSRTILSGSVYASRGAVSRLYSNDSTRLELSAAQSGTTWIADFYAATTITAGERATLQRLAVDYDGNVSASTASLQLRIYNWSTAAWEIVGGPWTGRTSDFGHTWSTTTSPTNYVSAGGQIRFSVRGSRSSSFRTRTDWVRFTIEY
jgi:subtilisin family serine protease